MEVNDIVSKVTANGVKYLELFIRDYTREFNTTVNPSCGKCIADYLRIYKEKFQAMENSSDYQLHKKREHLQLEFGSNIRVSNANITNEYAKRLISRYHPIHGEKTLDYLFSKYPKNETEIVVEELDVNIENLIKNTAEKPNDELTFSALKLKYPNIKARSREKFLAKISE
jgi:hypothetical protein